jgi:DNA-binding NarL/FixJ family response regulator
MSRTALLVEPSQVFRQRLQALAEAAGWRAIGRATLEDARKDIAAWAPELLVTSLKLGSFNGIHLVYLARHANAAAVCVVYGPPGEGEEARRADAVYVERNCVREALPEILAIRPRPGSRRSPVPLPEDKRVVDMRTHRKGR